MLDFRAWQHRGALVQRQPSVPGGPLIEEVAIALDGNLPSKVGDEKPSEVENRPDGWIVRWNEGIVPGHKGGVQGYSSADVSKVAGAPALVDPFDNRDLAGAERSETRVLVGERNDVATGGKRDVIRYIYIWLVAASGVNERAILVSVELVFDDPLHWPHHDDLIWITWDSAEKPHEIDLGKRVVAAMLPERRSRGQKGEAREQ